MGGNHSTNSWNSTSYLIGNTGSTSNDPAITSRSDDSLRIKADVQAGGMPGMNPVLIRFDTDADFNNFIGVHEIDIGVLPLDIDGSDVDPATIAVSSATILDHVVRPTKHVCKFTVESTQVVIRTDDDGIFGFLQSSMNKVKGVVELGMKHKETLGKVATHVSNFAADVSKSPDALAICPSKTLTIADQAMAYNNVIDRATYDMGTNSDEAGEYYYDDGMTRTLPDDEDDWIDDDDYKNLTVQDFATEEDTATTVRSIMRKARTRATTRRPPAPAKASSASSKTDILANGRIYVTPRTAKGALGNGFAASQGINAVQRSSEADLNGSRLAGKRVSVLPGLEHRSRILGNVPRGALPKVRGRIGIAGHNVGAGLVSGGRVTSSNANATTTALTQMITSTQTEFGRVGDVMRRNEAAADALAKVDQDKLLLLPKSQPAGQFIVPTHAYRTNVIDGCIRRPLTLSTMAEGTLLYPGTGVAMKLRIPFTDAIIEARDITSGRTEKAKIIAGALDGYELENRYIVNGKADHTVTMLIETYVTIGTMTSGLKVQVGLLTSVMYGGKLTPVYIPSHRLDAPEHSHDEFGLSIWKTSFDISDAEHGGLSRVANCPWKGTFAMVIAQLDTTANPPVIGIDDRSTELLVSPLRPENRYYFNGEAVTDKSIFDFIGMIDMGIRTSTAPNDVDVVWRSQIEPWIPYINAAAEAMIALDSRMSLDTTISSYSLIFQALNIMRTNQAGATTRVGDSAKATAKVLAMYIRQLDHWLHYGRSNRMSIDIPSQKYRKLVASRLFSTIGQIVPMLPYRGETTSIEKNAAPEYLRLGQLESALIEKLPVRPSV